MRLLYLNATGELGGAERSLLDVMSSVRQARPDWDLRLLCASDGSFREEAASLGVSTEVLEFPRALARIGEAGRLRSLAGSIGFGAQLAVAALPVAKYLDGLRVAIRSARPDIVHTNSLKMHVLGARAVHERPSLIWHLHDYIGGRPFTERFLKRTVERATAIVTNSQSVADDARATLGAGPPVFPVHNGVDLCRFHPAGPRADLDGLAGMPPAQPGVIRIGLVATFGRWKGHTTFLEAIARIPDELPIRAYIIGGALYQTSGSQYSAADLRRYAGRLGLGDRVGFTGFIARTEDALRALDIAVHASTAPEPFGLVIAEAMACGRAVIASDAGGAREIFTPGVDAVAHTPGSPESLARRIVELVESPDDRARLGRAGRQTVEHRFDRTRLARDLVPIYERAAPA
jgi:glycosyltransferase involved in cell wall biosynthesis